MASHGLPDSSGIRRSPERGDDSVGDLLVDHITDGDLKHEFQPMLELRVSYAYPMALALVASVGTGMYLLVRRLGCFDLLDRTGVVQRLFDSQE